MESIDITAKIFGSLDDILIHFLNELSEKDREKIYLLNNMNNDSIDEYHTLVKLIYEHSTHPNDSYNDDGTGRKNWNRVINLLRDYNLVIEKINHFHTSLKEHAYIPSDLVEESNFISKYLPELI